MPNKQNDPIKFALGFIGLFVVFYYFNICYLGLTSPGNFYSPFLAHNLNYIHVLRWVLLHSTMFILQCFGYTVIVNEYELLVAGHGIIQLIYSCLGLGVSSFFAAFVLAYPKTTKQKIIFLISGIIGIQFLNVLRFVLLALFWHKQNGIIVDHHLVFNILLYTAIGISLYFWVKNDVAINK